MFKRILVPLDGSSSSNKMAEVAVEIANRSNGEIIALSVVDGKDVTVETLGPLTVEAEGFVKVLEERCRKEGIEVKCIIRTGDPAGEIVSIAKEEKADAIMIATHCKPIEGFVLGSVTEKVLKEVPEGILVVTGKLKN